MQSFQQVLITIVQGATDFPDATVSIKIMYKQYMYQRLLSRVTIYDTIKSYNQLLQLCTACTAWSKWDQAVGPCKAATAGD